MTPDILRAHGIHRGDTETGAHGHRRRIRGLITALSDEPQHLTAWDRGAGAADETVLVAMPAVASAAAATRP